MLGESSVVSLSIVKDVKDVVAPTAFSRLIVPGALMVNA